MEAVDIKQNFSPPWLGQALGMLCHFTFRQCYEQSLSTLHLVMLQQLTIPWVNDLSAGWAKCGVCLNSAAFLDKTCVLA